MAVTMSRETTSAPVSLGEYVPTADQRIVLGGLSWSGFRTLLELRGDRSRPRMAYLDGAVELMGTSRGHEGMKHDCLERGIDFQPYGNWLLDDESEKAGAEPDECFMFGSDPGAKERPDLMIEVVWTSGGIDKLEIYRRLKIGEVWFWIVSSRSAKRFASCAPGCEHETSSVCESVRRHRKTSAR
jgi:hypothetical protein